MKFSWSIDVHEALSAELFKLEIVTDHCWGLYVQTQPMRRTPAPSRRAVRPAIPRKRVRHAAELAAQFKNTRQRLRSASMSPLRRRSKCPQIYAECGSRQADIQKRPGSGERTPAAEPDTKRWCFPLTQQASGAPTSIRSGADLKVLGSHDVKSGAVIEVTKATDAEEGPDAPEPDEQRTSIQSKKGEYFLETVPPGATAKDVADALQVAHAEVQVAVTNACQQVTSATHDAEQTVVSLCTSLSVAKAEMARAAAVMEKVKAEIEAARQPPSVEGVPSGYRQVEGAAEVDMISPLEAPVLSQIVMVPDQEDIEETEPVEPELLTNYDIVLERPSGCEVECSTLLGAQVWERAEAVADTATEADLDNLRIRACADEWQTLVSAATPPPSQGVAGYRQVEGTPMIVQISTAGGLLQNAMRKLGRKHTRSIHVQAFVCRN